MKPVAYLTLSICIFSLLTTACRREDDHFPPADSCQISANVDGVDYRWDLGFCQFNNDRLQVGDIALDEAALSIDPINSTGIYSTLDPQLSITLLLSLGPVTQIFPAEVQIEVTSFSDDEASGNFEGLYNSA